MTNKVYSAINSVQRELVKTGIGKGQINQFDKYKFRGIDDVYNSLGPALANAGLVILPRCTERNVEERQTAKGGITYAVTLKVEFDFISAEDGSQHTVIAYGEAMDRGDKATPKAMAAAFKYAAFQAFCIPTEGSPDADSESHTVSVERITANKVSQIMAAIDATNTNMTKFLGAFGIEAVSDLTASQFNVAARQLKAKAAKMEEAK